MIASEDAHHAIANAIDDDRTLSLFGYTRAAHALAVVMPDGRTIGQWLDALAALEAAVRRLHAAENSIEVIAAGDAITRLLPKAQP